MVAVNDDLVSNPSRANSEPYDKEWIIILKPENWDQVKPTLTPGVDVIEKYEAKMASKGFSGCH